PRITEGVRGKIERMKQVFEVVNRVRYEEAVAVLESFIQSGNGSRLRAMLDEILAGPNRFYDDDCAWNYFLPYLRELGDRLGNPSAEDERRQLIKNDLGGVIVNGWAQQGFKKIWMSAALRRFLDGKSRWLARFGMGDYPGEKLPLSLQWVSWFI